MEICRYNLIALKKNINLQIEPFCIKGKWKFADRTFLHWEFKWVNFNISMDRAENTAILLARLGIPADSIIIMARSDREQVSNEHMPSSESENRRADIYIEY